MKTLTKLLSPNDVGFTHSHQAGILVPKHGGYLEFFPKLDANIYNPDAMLAFIDPDGKRWLFRFIYYNNACFRGTRNEYRLTRMTRFFNQFGAKPGDGLLLTHIGNKYYVRVVSAPSLTAPIQDSQLLLPCMAESKETIRLVFDTNWNLIESEE